MTRIISGYLGSMQLKGAAKATRPTSDRVKESLFAKLDAMGVIEGSRVLDLFAGTGALGLECVSRGAQSVVFIEQDRSAFALLQQNISAAKSSLEKQSLTAELKANQSDAKKFLRGCSDTFDLVFIDPPYQMPQEEIQEVFSNLHKHLTSESTVIYERSSRSEEFLETDFRVVNVKRYGDTELLFLEINREEEMT